MPTRSAIARSSSAQTADRRAAVARATSGGTSPAWIDSAAATGPWRRTQSQTGMLAGSATRLRYARARITDSSAPCGVIGRPRYASARRGCRDPSPSSPDHLRTRGPGEAPGTQVPRHRISSTREAPATRRHKPLVIGPAPRTSAGQCFRDAYPSSARDVALPGMGLPVGRSAPARHRSVRGVRAITLPMTRPNRGGSTSLRRHH